MLERGAAAASSLDPTRPIIEKVRKFANVANTGAFSLRLVRNESDLAWHNLQHKNASIGALHCKTTQAGPPEVEIDTYLKQPDSDF